MRKTILIISLTLLLIGFVVAQLTNTDLGYRIEETESVTTTNLENCLDFNTDITLNELNDLVLRDAQPYINATPNIAQISDLSRTIYPENGKVCWALQINHTTTQKTVTYTDKDLFDTILNTVYNYETKEWVTPKK